MMNSIKLTKEQKDKLLEMCKELFPEYKTIQIFDGSCDYCLENTIKLSKEDNPIHNDWLLIPWFEFCLTHLFTKLIVKQYGYMSISDAMSNGYYIIHNQNPVDYLYEQFQLLK